MDFATMCVQGSAMIAVVCALRWLLGARLPKAAFTVLWAVVLLRMLVPFSIPVAQNFWSLFDAGVPAASEVSQVDQPTGMVGEGEPVAGALVPDGTPASFAAFADAPLTVAASGDTAVTGGVSVAGVVWAMGVLAVAVYFLLAYVRGLRVFAKAVPVDNARARQWLSAHRLRLRRIRIVESDRVASPLTYGVARPTIVVPAGFDWRDPSKSALVLEHEYVHITRFDALYKAALCSVACLHWFNPLSWAMFVLANRDIELACDEKVAARLNGYGRSLYAQALVDAAEMYAVLSPAFASFRRRGVEERVRALRSVRPLTLASGLALALTAGSMVAAFATTPEDAAPEVAPGRPAASTGEPAVVVDRSDVHNEYVYAYRYQKFDPCTKLVTARYTVTLYDFLFPDGFDYAFMPTSTAPWFEGMRDILAVTDRGSGEVVLYVYCYPRDPNYPQYSVPGDPGEVPGYQVEDWGRSDGDLSWGVGVATLQSYADAYDFEEWGGVPMFPVSGSGTLNDVRGFDRHETNLPDGCYIAHAVEEEGGVRVVTPYYSVLIPREWLGTQEGWENGDWGVGYTEGSLGPDGTHICREVSVSLPSGHYFFVYCAAGPLGSVSGWSDRWTGLTTEDGLGIYIHEALSPLVGPSGVDFVTWVHPLA